MRTGANSPRGRALFLLLHACAALAIAAHARIANARALVIVGFVMEAGAILFSAELAMHVFAGVRIFRFAAPVGGTYDASGSRWRWFSPSPAGGARDPGRPIR